MTQVKPIDLDVFECHKWIAVGDIYIDYPLMDYDQYNFNDLYIVERSGDNDGVFGLYRPRRNGVRAWSRADLLCYIRNYKKLLTFIDLRAKFMNLRTDEKVLVNGKLKQKVFIFFPSSNEIETAVTCMYLYHYNHRYSVTDEIPF